MAAVNVVLNHLQSKPDATAREGFSARALARTVLAATTCLALVGAVPAAQVRTQFGVGVLVLPTAKLERLLAPSTLRLSAQDVRRGFVDVAQPLSILVRSNSPQGIALDLTTLNPMLRSIVVNGVDSTQILGADGGTLVRRWNGPQALRMDLTFRLVLAPGLAAGQYPWPLHLDVRPL